MNDMTGLDKVRINQFFDHPSVEAHGLVWMCKCEAVEFGS